MNCVTASQASMRCASFCTALLITLLATGTTTSVAQPADSTLRKGAWAVQFKITPNFTLDAFEGATLSAKKHLSATRAVRFGVTLEAGLSDEDADAGTATSDISNQELRASVQFLAYRQRRSPVHFYFGPGLRTAFDRATRTRQNGDQVLEDVIIFTWSAGLTGTLGVEWFMHSHISLLAEYGSALQFSIQDFEGDSRQPAISRTALFLRPDGVRFGLSVYL